MSEARPAGSVAQLAVGDVFQVLPVGRLAVPPGRLQQLVPEEIAFKYGWISRDKLLESAERYGKSPYGQHLKNVADGKLRY